MLSNRLRMNVTKGVLIVGLGGLGVPAAIAAVRGGVRILGLVDPDPVELSNLPRQVIYREADLGRLKVDAAAERLSRSTPGLEVERMPFALEPRNAQRILGEFGFIVDATDNPAIKFLINDLCVAAGIPFVYGGVLGMAGQAMSVLPGRTACLRCLFEGPPEESEMASCRDAGIIGPVAGAIGMIQGDEAARWNRGEPLELAGKMMVYEGARGGRPRVIEAGVRERCGCGAARAAARIEAGYRAG